ncbi:hypothetical protein D3C77_754950 [compost metagenome]
MPAAVGLLQAWARLDSGCLHEVAFRAIALFEAIVSPLQAFVELRAQRGLAGRGICNLFFQQVVLPRKVLRF